MEELGNREGMAASYHERGNLSYLRGIYDEALQWYRKSLAIREELGEREGMAACCHQLSLLFTGLGKPEEGLPYGLRSLALAIELQSPRIPIVLHVLTRQREVLGVDRFRQLASEHLDADSVTRVVELLDRFAAEKSGRGND